MTNTEIRNQFLYDYTGLKFDTWDETIISLKENDSRLNSHFVTLTEDSKNGFATPERILFIALITVLNVQEDNIGKNDGYLYFIHPSYHKDKELFSEVIELVKDLYKTVHTSNEYLVTNWEVWNTDFQGFVEKALTNDFIFDMPNQRIVFTKPNNGMKYEVVVVPNDRDKTKKQTYTFENLNPLVARRAAIAKAKELESTNSDCHVLITFKPEKDAGYDSTLYGDFKEETKEALQSEINRFDKLGLEFETTLMQLDEDEEDSDEIDVIAEDFEYLMS